MCQLLNPLGYNRYLQIHGHTGSPGQSQSTSVTQSKMNSHEQEKEKILVEGRVLTG